MANASFIINNEDLRHDSVLDLVSDILKIFIKNSTLIVNRLQFKEKNICLDIEGCNLVSARESGG